MDAPEPVDPWTPAEGAQPADSPAPSPAPEAGPAAAVAADRPRRHTGRAIALVAAGAVAATIITGIAFAKDNSPSPSASGAAAGTGQQQPGLGGQGMGGQGMGGPDGDRGGFGGPGMGGLDFLAGGQVLHGEIVVQKADGSTVTVRVQGGTVKSASASELVVASTDGTEQTWPITAQTHVHRGGQDAAAADIQTGDTVMVVGEVSGSTVTTTRVQVMGPGGDRQRMPSPEPTLTS